MVRSKKEGKIKTKKIVKKAIVSSVSQTWSKYIKNKKEKAMITKLVKKIENKDRFVSSKKKKFEIYNLGSGKSISIKNLVHDCSRISNTKLKIVLSKEKSRKNEIMNVQANISKMKKELNWKPKISLNEGLEKTFNYYN